MTSTTTVTLDISKLVAEIELNQDYIASRIQTSQDEGVTESMLMVNLGRIHALTLLGEHRESSRLSGRGLRVTHRARVIAKFDPICRASKARCDAAREVVRLEREAARAG